jgi:hypothetical protein
MTTADRVARSKLIDYAEKFLKVAARPTEPVRVTTAQVAAFAAQVREGCRQDLIRLILHLADDNLHATGKDALIALAGTLNEGESIELWGLPDCSCGKEQCVYCARGFAIHSTLTAT